MKICKIKIKYIQNYHFLFFYKNKFIINKNNNLKLDEIDANLLFLILHLKS